MAKLKKKKKRKRKTRIIIGERKNGGLNMIVLTLMSKALDKAIQSSERVSRSSYSFAYMREPSILTSY